ncbi:MAG: ABC transporter permease [Oscillospiraceae bacterium]
MKNKAFNLKVLARYTPYIILLVLCVVMTIATENFLTFSNIINVLKQSSFLLVMALGMTFAMILGRGADMSLGATVAISSCLAAHFLKASCDPLTIVFGFILAIAIGAAVGVINGALIAYLRLPALLVTYGMQNILRGVIYSIMEGDIVTNLHKSVTFLGSGLIGKIPVPIIIAALLTLLTVFILKKTTLGRRLYIVGANPEAARFSGIKSNLSIIIGFAMTGVMAAIAGIMYIGRLGTAEAQIGSEFHLNAIAAAAIGGVSFNGGIANPGGVVAGAIILNLLTNGMNLLNISSNWQGFINGVIIIFAVLIDYFTNRKNR